MALRYGSGDQIKPNHLAAAATVRATRSPLFIARCGSQVVEAGG